ncbi:hypothetical protein ACV229_36005 [Burkholderia sp. MR1-5-21]
MEVTLDERHAFAAAVDTGSITVAAAAARPDRVGDEPHAAKKNLGHRGTVTEARIGIRSLARGLDARAVYFDSLRFQTTLNGRFWGLFQSNGRAGVVVMTLSS